jgi:hypothetical protein
VFASSWSFDGRWRTYFGVGRTSVDKRFARAPTCQIIGASLAGQPLQARRRHAASVVPDEPMSNLLPISVGAVDASGPGSNRPQANWLRTARGRRDRLPADHSHGRQALFPLMTRSEQARRSHVEQELRGTGRSLRRRRDGRGAGRSPRQPLPLRDDPPAEHALAHRAVADAPRESGAERWWQPASPDRLETTTGSPADCATLEVEVHETSPLSKSPTINPFWISDLRHGQRGGLLILWSTVVQLLGMRLCHRRTND